MESKQSSSNFSSSILQERSYSFIPNPGGGDCGVYAVMHAMWGKEADVSFKRAQIIRGQIADVMSGFVQLHRYRESLKGPPYENSQKVINIYHRIFSNPNDGFASFKFIATETLKAPLADSDTNMESRESVESHLSRLERMDSWEELQRDTNLVIYLFMDICSDFGIDVAAAIFDHNSVQEVVLDPHTCSAEEYHMHISRSGVWLDNNELTGYLLSCGYMQCGKRYLESGTVIEFRNSLGEIIALHNDARDMGAASLGQAAGNHWQGIRLITRTLANLSEDGVPTSREFCPQLKEIRLEEEFNKKVKAFSIGDSELLKSKMPENIPSNFVDVISVHRLNSLESIIRRAAQEMEDIFDSEQDAYSKILSLKDTEILYTSTIVKEVVSSKDLQTLVSVLEDIGNLNQCFATFIEYAEHELLHGGSNAKREHKYPEDAMQYYLESAIHYSAAIKIIETHFNYEIETTQRIYNNLFGTYKEIRKITSAQELQLQELNLFDKINSDRQVLQDIRKLVKIRLEKLRGLDYVENSESYQDLFLYISSKMHDFLYQLFERSQKELGPSPCRYSVIGLGSIASCQSTPYSDIEFAILTENMDFKSNTDPRIRNYFKNLSYIVNFYVICLGETAIPESKYEVKLDTIIVPGIMFDLGGKTPLGRSDKDYELIGTPQYMREYIINGNGKINDNNLSNILIQSVHIIGSREITKEYQDLILTTLLEDSKTHSLYREQALRLLGSGIKESEDLVLSLANFFKGDMVKLNSLCSNNILSKKLFNVKLEIYRVPDRLIYNLSLYYEINFLNIWDALEKLLESKIICEEGKKNLLYIVNFTFMLRLQTYMHYHGQLEYISLLDVEGIVINNNIQYFNSKLFHLSPEELSEQGPLFRYFYISIPFYESIKEFILINKFLSDSEKSKFFSYNLFFENNAENNGIIHYRLANYNLAFSYLKHLMEKIDTLNTKILDCIYILGNICYILGDIQKAIYLFEYYLETCLKLDAFSSTSAYNSLNIQNTNLRLLAMYNLHSMHDKAYELCIQTLKIYREHGLYRVLSDEHCKFLSNKHQKYQDIYCNSFLHTDSKLVAICLSEIGEAKRLAGEYDIALLYQNQSLKMFKRLNSNTGSMLDNIVLANNRMGLIYLCINQLDNALQRFYLSIKMLETQYQNEPNIMQGLTQNYIAKIYKLKHNFVCAKYFLLKALYTITTSSHDSINFINEVYFDLREVICINYLMHNQSMQKKFILFIEAMDMSFVDYNVHYNLAKSLHFENKEEAIEEYLLALLFLPTDQQEVCNSIKEKLLELRISFQEIELWQHVVEGKLDSLKKLIEKIPSLDLDNVSFMRVSPLIQAIINGHTEIVDTLLSLGANPNIPMDNGDTPMHVAHYKGNIDAIKLLLRYNAIINSSNKEGKTPLHCLLEQHDLETETKLTIIKECSHLYNFNITDNGSKTPLDYARQYYPGFLEFIKPWFQHPDFTHEEVSMGAEQMWDEYMQARLLLELSGNITDAAGL